MKQYHHILPRICEGNRSSRGLGFDLAQIDVTQRETRQGLETGPDLVLEYNTETRLGFLMTFRRDQLLSNKDVTRDGVISIVFDAFHQDIQTVDFCSFLARNRGTKQG